MSIGLAISLAGGIASAAAKSSVYSQLYESDGNIYFNGQVAKDLYKALQMKTEFTRLGGRGVTKSKVGDGILCTETPFAPKEINRHQCYFSVEFDSGKTSSFLIGGAE